LTESGEYTSADRYLEEALAMRTRLFGKSHPDVASSLVHVAILQVATQKYSDAALSARTAAGIFTTAFSATSWRTGLAETVDGAALAGMGEYPAAEKSLLHGYAILKDDASTVRMYRVLARRYVEDLYRRWGRPQDARRYADAKDRPAAGLPANPPATAVLTPK
jgi:hypothetical protein